MSPLPPRAAAVLSFIGVSHEARCVVTFRDRGAGKFDIDASNAHIGGTVAAQRFVTTAEFNVMTSRLALREDEIVASDEVDLVLKLKTWTEEMRKSGHPNFMAASGENDDFEILAYNGDGHVPVGGRIRVGVALMVATMMKLGARTTNDLAVFLTHIGKPIAVAPADAESYRTNPIWGAF